MTPKEKAIELVYKFYIQIPLLDGCSWCNANYKCENKCEKKHKSAKQCALIAVDEIIKSNPTKVTENAVWFKLNIEYWQEVKQEIENL